MTLPISIENTPYTVSKPAAKLETYHSKLGRQTWSPVGLRNGAILFEDPKRMKRFLVYVSRNAKKSRVNIDAHVITFHPFDISFWEHNTLKQTTYANSLSVLLDELIVLRTAIRKKTRTLGRTDAKRKITYVFIVLDTNAIKDLKKPEVQQQALDLMSNSDGERIYPFFCAPFAKDIPPGVLSSFDWTAFLGEENSSLARGMYSTLEEAIYNEKRRVDGIIHNILLNRLVPIHDTIFVPSEYQIEFDRVAAIEEEAFKNMLESLN